MKFLESGFMHPKISEVQTNLKVPQVDGLFESMMKCTIWVSEAVCPTFIKLCDLMNLA